MANDETDRLLGEIGQLLAQDTAYPLDGTLLYARVRSTMVAPAIFKNQGNNIVYRRPTWTDWATRCSCSGMPRSRKTVGPKSSISS